MSRRMQRVRLLTAQDLRGGARTKSHCTNQDKFVPTKAPVFCPKVSAACIPACVPVATKDTGMLPFYIPCPPHGFLGRFLVRRSTRKKNLERHMVFWEGSWCKGRLTKKRLKRHMVFWEGS